MGCFNDTVSVRIVILHTDMRIMMVSNNNKHKKLGRLAITRAWFDPVADTTPPRHAFKMDIVFTNERLGGGPDDPVRFRVGMKQCEVVVIPPISDPSIRIDERTILSGSSPATVTIKRETEASAEVSGEAHLDLGATGLSSGANVKAAAKRRRVVHASTEEVLPVLLGTRSQSQEGHQSWNIRRIDGTETLEGQLWDAHADGPRFELLDRRPEMARESDKRTGLHPAVVVEIRCKREDLEIVDIDVTDSADAKIMLGLPSRKKAMKVAEAFLKQQLQKECLRVGDIHEPFSDIVVGDLLVSMVDDDDI